MSLFRFAMLAVASTLTQSGTVLAAPAVTLSPGVGPPTTTLTATGTGFVANTAVDVFFDTADVCFTFSDGAGKAVCTIKVPKDAQPQQHWVSMMQRSNYSGAQKPFLVRTDMPQFHGRNAAHNGLNPFENTLDVTNVGNLDVLWQQYLGTSFYSSPVVASGVVYAAGGNGYIYAFNAQTGAPVPGFAKVASPTGIAGSAPAVGSGKVFVGGLDSKLHVFNQSNGALLADIVLPGTVHSSPALALGNVYVACDDGHVLAFNATTLAPTAGFTPPQMAGTTSVTGSPTIVGGRIYIGTSNNAVYAFDALTGAYIASLPTPASIVGTVAAANGAGYVASTNGNVWGFNLMSMFDVPFLDFSIGNSSHAEGSPAVAGGTAYIGGLDAFLYAKSTSSASLPWITALPDDVYGSPMVADGVIYVAGYYDLFAVDAKSGTVLWSANIPSYLYPNSAVVANGIVYHASPDGNMYAFSVNGLPPSARLPGGALGVQPALSVLKPNYALKPSSGAAVSAPVEGE